MSRIGEGAHGVVFKAKRIETGNNYCHLSVMPVMFLAAYFLHLQFYVLYFVRPPCCFEKGTPWASGGWNSKYGIRFA